MSEQVFSQADLPRKNIRTDTYISLGFVFLSMIVIMGAVIFTFRQNYDQVRDFSAKLDQVRFQIEDILFIYNQQTTNRKNLFIRGTTDSRSMQKYVALINEDSHKIYERLQILYADLALDPDLHEERLKHLKQFERDHKDLMKVYDQAVSILRKSGDMNRADFYTKGKDSDVVDYIIKIRNSLNQQKEEYLETNNEFTTRLTLIIFGVLIVIFVALAWGTSRRVMRPISRMTKFSKFITDMSTSGASGLESYPLDRNDDIGDVIKSFNAFTAAIDSHQRILAEALEKRTKELEKAHEESMSDREQLVQAEKMASLGNLVAGIAHELNTPAGVINSAAQSLAGNINESVQALRDIYKEVTDPKLLEAFEIFVEDVSSTVQEKDISTSEQRALAKEVAELVSEINPNLKARSVSKEIVASGITVDQFKKATVLYQSENAEHIHKQLCKIPGTQTSIRDIKIGISRVIHLVKALKSYSSSDGTAKETMTINQGIDDTLVILHNKLKQNIVIQKQLDSQDQLFGAAERLNQIWTNLINNGVQAMGGVGQLHIRTKDEDGYVIVEIEDEGTGIPEDIQGKIFDAYFTTKKRGEGTGLGLHIIKDIIKEHDGSITFETEKDKGTCFIVKIPNVETRKTLVQEQKEQEVSSEGQGSSAE